MTVGSDYLARLGLNRADITTSVESLQSMLTAHLEAIPFEDLTSFSGGVVDLDPEALSAKLLHSARGGYCFEHAGIARTALAELGFTTRQALARPQPGHGPLHMKSHSVTIVTIVGREWLYDPGFGGTSPTAVLPLDTLGDIADTPLGRYRLVAPEDSGLPASDLVDAAAVYQTSFGGADFENGYVLTSGPVVDSDVAAFNWMTSTHPASRFTTMLVLARVDGDTRITMGNTTRRRRTGSATDVRELTTRADLDEVLAEDFHIDAPADMVSTMATRLNLA